MANRKPEKKPDPPPPVIHQLLPLELQIGARLTDETGEWEVISRPYPSAGDRLVSAHLQRVGKPAVKDLRTWEAHDRINVKRGRLKEAEPWRG